MMDFKAAPELNFHQPKQHTTQPIVQGASVLACKYDGGVMVMADTLASYGGLARFKNTQRVKAVNSKVLVAAGGEYSDFQAIGDLLDGLNVEDFEHDDGHVSNAKEISAYLTRVMYQRRSKVDPLWNDVVVAGYTDDGKSFLGMTDIYGTQHTADVVATGFGSYMALPLLRKEWKADLTEAEAKKLLSDCMRVLFYRHCRTINKFNIATITKDDGPNIEDPVELSTYWEHSRFVDPLK